MLLKSYRGFDESYMHLFYKNFTDKKWLSATGQKIAVGKTGWFF